MKKLVSNQNLGSPTVDDYFLSSKTTGKFSWRGASESFPTGDYGNLSTSDTDAFGQRLATSFDCLTTPSSSLSTIDLGALS